MMSKSSAQRVADQPGTASLGAADSPIPHISLQARIHTNSEMRGLVNKVFIRYLQNRTSGFISSLWTKQEFLYCTRYETVTLKRCVRSNN